MSAKSPSSLRKVLVITLAATIIAFVMMFFVISSINMSHILLNAEQDHMQKLSIIVSDCLNNSRRSSVIVAKDIAFWNNTVNYVLDPNQEYLDNWDNSSIIQNIDNDFVMIKDLEGDDVYCGFSENMQAKLSDEGAYEMSESISEIAKNVLADYNTMYSGKSFSADIDGAQGMITVDGNTFDICIMPIATRESPVPAGAVVVGDLIDSQYMRDKTYFYDADFEIESFQSKPNNTAFETTKLNGGFISVKLFLDNPDSGVYFDYFSISINLSRDIYNNGIRVVYILDIVFILSSFAFAVILYALLVRNLVNPVEKLSYDIGQASEIIEIDTSQYSSLEMQTMCKEINGMINRFNQTESMVMESHASMNIISGILDNVDALLYVTDLEDDSILYINDKMRQHYNLTDDLLVGQPCWKILQTNMTDRCGFCPVHRLLEENDAIIVWDEVSTATGRTYHNTDCIIDWTDGKKAHLQHSVDITDIISVQEETRIIKNRLAVAMTASGAGAWEMDFLADIYTCDETTCEMFKYPFGAGEISMKELRDYLDKILLGDSGRELIYLIDTKAYNQPSISREIKLNFLDGTVRYIHIYASVILDENKSPTHIIGMCMDITDNKLTEISLGHQLKQQELMSDISQSFISATDTDELIDNALRTVGRFMNMCRVTLACIDDSETDDYVKVTNEWCDEPHIANSLKGHKFKFFRNSNLYSNLANKNAVFINDKTLSKEESSVHFNGVGADFFVSAPVFVESTLVGIISFSDNNADRSWTESDAQLARMMAGIISGVLLRDKTETVLARMSAVVESSPYFVAYISADGSFEYVNKGAAALSGYSEEELLEGKIHLLFQKEDIKKIQFDITDYVTKYGFGEFELTLIRKDGEERIVWCSVFRTGFKSLGVGAIATDITEQRQMEKDLIAAKEEAEDASKAKGDFLSRMSHEMRTPMNAIIGMTSIAKASSDAERKEYCLDKIGDASKHLLGIINDVLDMSKIEANKFELFNLEFDFEKMLMRVVDVLNFRIEEKKQRFIINMESDIPQFLISDEQRLAQIITNLLSNAVKFTPEEGTITLSVSVLSAVDNVYKLAVSVTDTGIGISEEQQRKLFHSFEQADGGITRKFGGTGLGLAISKKIIDLMGGMIYVESKLGEGTTFAFEVEMQRGNSEWTRDVFENFATNKKLNILAVDDDIEVLNCFMSIMNQRESVCEVMPSGKKALELIKKQDFDIVFLDLKISGADSIELARAIKDVSSKTNVVIMASAIERDEIEEKAREAGVEYFISKPIFPSVLVDCINECLGGKSVSGSQHEEKRDYRGYNLLLAEDVEINREIVISLLEDTGIEIECAENGKIAVDMFSENPQKYDMIFMDIHMPEMDGFEASRLIRALDVPEAGLVPIVAMTANVFREDVEKCLAAGMNDHTGKPIDMNEMFAKLDTYLRLNK